MTRQRSRIVATLGATIVTTLGFTASSFAAGFELQEQSGIGLGQAFAGATAGYGDGSEVYWNPAAMMAIDGTTASASLHTIIPSTSFDDGGSNLPALGGVPLVGNDGGNGGEVALVPNAYGVTDLIPDKLKFGIGLNVPFGLETQWDDGWTGRYQALKSELRTINVNPALAMNVTDNVSIGVGASIMFLDAELSNAIDFGTIGVATLGPTTAGSLGLLPQQADGKVTLNGDDTAYGVNAGVMIRPTDDIR
ncbi:MAG: outer membrane protein transport protein, partial [Bdellovibrionales bacterium]|nr:outer membrane protein transport protein [Bdellovibrionales bacterium]